MQHQTLYTLGYTRLNRDKLVQWAQDNNALIADIRIRPYSRNAQYNQKKLIEVLGDHYTHIGALGNENYKGGLTKLVNEAVGVKQVLHLLESQPVVLFCVCKDHLQCHRLDVVHALPQAVQETVVHLSVGDINGYGEASQTSFFTHLSEEDIP